MFRVNLCPTEWPGEQGQMDNGVRHPGTPWQDRGIYEDRLSNENPDSRANESRVVIALTQPCTVW